MKPSSPLLRVTLARLMLMLMSCLALPGCATSLVSVYREEPPESGRYTRSSGVQIGEAVAIYRQGQRIAAGLPLALQPADVLETGPGSLAVIRYADGGEVVLDVRTRVRIGSLFVDFGRILARVHGLFAADTEFVITGVEGTEYTLEARRGGAVAVIVLDGAVLCRSKSGSWEPVRVRRGEAFLADSQGRSRPEVRPASPGEMEDIRGLRCSAEGRGPQCRQLGFCCHDGRVFGSARESCRGFFSNLEEEAVRRCEEDVQHGYCCDDGRVAQATRDQCERYRGAFYRSRALAERACGAPRDEGYCCARGKVFASTRQRCESADGSFHERETEAVRRCEESTQSGYCCDGGQVIRTDPDACGRKRGTFFRDREQAERACRAQREEGYCCARGKVFMATRERCERVRGSFHEDKTRATRACMRPAEVFPRLPESSTPPLR